MREVAHEDAGGLQPFVHRARIEGPEARHRDEQEVRFRGRRREPEVRERAAEAAAFLAHAAPGVCRVRLVAHCRGGQCLRQRVHVVAVAGLADDRRQQLGRGDAVGEAQARQRVALAQRAQQQHVRQRARERHHVVPVRRVHEVDVGLVHQQHAAELPRHRLEQRRAQQRARGGVRVHHHREVRARRIPARHRVCGRLEFGVQRHLRERAVLDLRQHRVQRVRGLEHAQRHAGIEEGGDRQAQQFVAAVGHHHVVARDAVHGGGGVAEVVRERRRVAAQARDVEGRECGGHGRGRRVGVLVGVELQGVGVLGLLAPGVALHLADVAAFVGHGSGQFGGARRGRA